MNNKVLVIGASGYIGARLIPKLLERGYKVRATSRLLSSLMLRPWVNDRDLETYPVDVLSRDSLAQACYGCDYVYYLVHSMKYNRKNYSEDDRVAAKNMIKAAKEAGVKRIVYLGGLGEQNKDLSQHLRSRSEVAQILHSGSVPVTTLRAAMIIGTGSLSFEILGYLSRRLPIMITPRWVNTLSQPIAVRNVLEYLVRCLEREETAGQTYDIGGSEIISYKDLIQMYAREAGKRAPIIIPVPILTPKLSSYWIQFVTPIPYQLARPLIEGLRNKVVCQDDRIKKVIPQELLSCREAIRLALNSEKVNPLMQAKSSWRYPFPECRYPGDPSWVRVDAIKNTIYKTRTNSSIK